YGSLAMRETRLFRPRPVFDLKWSLLRQVAAVALLCFLGGAAFSVYQAGEETLRANQAVGEAIGRYLGMPVLLHRELPAVLRERIDIQRRFREMDALEQVMSPGQCVRIHEAGKNAVSSCLGFRSQDGEAPAWFSAFYQWAVGSRLTYERPITH